MTGIIKKLSVLSLAILCFLSFSYSKSWASCPVSVAGQYIMTYNNGTKFMAACKFGDSLRNLCGNVGVSCTAGQEGDVEYNTAGNVLRYCNGSNWVNVQCEALTSCVGTPAGTISADATQMKYCNGTTWQAMYSDGICTGIGVQEALFTPTAATHGQNAMYYGFEQQSAITDTYAIVGAPRATRNRLFDGAATIYKRSGASWTRLKEVEPSVTGTSHYFGQSVAIDGDYTIVGAYNANRIAIFKKDQGGADNWGQVATRTGSDNHGISVDISGDKAIAGSNAHNAAVINQGNARIYRRDSGGADSWGQVVILNHPDATPVTSDQFGRAVAIAGDIAVVAGGYRTEAGVSNAGAVWLFHETSADNWVFLKKLTNPNGLGASDYFGFSVDIQDNDGNGTADRLAVGALGDDEYGSNRGGVFIFERNQGGADNWGFVTQAVDTSIASATDQGREVTLAADRVITGSRISDEEAYDAGAAFVFQKDAGGANNWGLEQYLHASDASERNEFGRSVGISKTGTYAIAGAPYTENSATNVGAAYIFSRSGTTWTERSKQIPHSSVEYSVRMGDSVVVSGDYAAVGMAWKTDFFNSNRISRTGGVNIYQRQPNSTWVLEKHVVPTSPVNDMQFGQTLAISPEILVVATPGDNTGAGNSGAALLHGRNQGGAGNWGLIKKVKHGDPQSSDYATNENGLALFGDYLVIGASRKNLNLVSPQGSAGAAYIFKRNQGGADNWGQIKKLVAPVEENGAYFGNSVSMGGTTLAVGARLEDSNGTNSGSVYLYSRDQGGAENWGQIKKFTGESASDHFGYDVAVSGNTLAIGAPYDDDAGGDAGAVYIHYEDQGGAGNWGQFKKIVYNGGGVGNALFGFNIDLSGDILIVGAPYDDRNVTNGGYVYVYSRNEGGDDNWGLLATIDPDVPGEEDLFGYSVAVSGNVVAGAGLYNDDYGKDDGSVYLFGCPPTP